ncbi:MAG: hypothetical protein VXW00_04055, partial [Candidatus Latescibacterota bacterium]|nr:hypothetical protein [Candidatus Latescibacterota bacterium]
FGEVGLSGEVRPVASGQERIREAAKHGFKKAIVPSANAPIHAYIGPLGGAPGMLPISISRCSR